mmetsp:Transcript_120110/g.179461  ORF Transcript_120110/g.179461 Transcript_120110/m.179461 type:complete len:211 (-) Transcript_120110:2760-3392(-)
MNTSLTHTKEDIKKLLLCNCHLGSRRCESLMTPYTWRKRIDGIYIINIAKTIEKLRLAARAIVAVKTPTNVMAISTESIGQRAVIRFSYYTGCQMVLGRWMPGKLTNQMCQEYSEPQLIILTNPSLDSQPLSEASYVNIPTIAFCNTDSSLKFVDISIPGNNQHRYSVAILWWMLTKEVLKLKGQLGPHDDWDVSIDLFLDYKENKNKQI